jgi:hypothetical protein
MALECLSLINAFESLIRIAYAEQGINQGNYDYSFARFLLRKVIHKRVRNYISIVHSGYWKNPF